MCDVCRPWRRLFLLLLFAVPAARGQSLPQTTISDVVYRADGTPAQGTLLIFWPEFTTSGGQAVAAGTNSVTLGTGGTLTVALVPNVGATPPNTVYTVVYQLDDGTVKTEYWIVPTTSPATLAQVRTTLGASENAALFATQQFVTSGLATKADDSAVVHLNGSETITGSKQFSVAPSLPNPVQPGDATNKQYVDNAVQNVGSGNYLSLAGGTLTGALTLSGDPTAPDQAATKHYSDLWAAVKADLLAGLVPPTELGSGTPNSATCLLGNQTWGPCSASGSGSVYVNNALVANPNFNATTPGPQSNFLNCTFQGGSSTVSLECPYGSGASAFALGSEAVLNNQANAFSTGLQDFSAARLKLPSGAGFEPATNGEIGFDTTANLPVIGISGVTQQIALTTSNISGQASTALALAGTPAQCNGSFATGIQANGNANCSVADVVELAETAPPSGIPNYGIFWFDSATHTPRVIDNNGQAVQLGLLNVFNSDANTLEEYNGTNPQTLNIYGTRTDASDYERLRLGFDTTDNYFFLAADAAGTGILQPGLAFLVQGSLRWVIDSSFNFKPWSDNIKDVGAPLLRLKHVYVGTYADLTGGAEVTEIPNQATTGTTLNALAKVTGAPATAVVASTSDTSGVIGVVVDGAGTTGSAQIARGGQAACAFDGATTTGDYVQISGTTAGDCHDAGASYPGTGQVLGRVLSTNGAGGTYAMLVAGSETQAPPQGAVGSVFGRSGTVSAQTGDYNVGQVTGAAPLASPAFTGTTAVPMFNNVAYIDGTTFTSPQSVYAANPTFAGVIHWTAPFGGTVPISVDPYLNTASAGTVVAAITSSCSGITNFVPSGDYVEVEAAVYDIYGEQIYTQTAMTPTAASGSSQCYKLTTTPAAIAGATGWSLFAQACAASPCASFTPTLQDNGSGASLFTTFSQQTFNSTTASNGPGTQPLPANSGLEVSQVTIQLYSNSYVTSVPISVPGNSVLRGQGQFATKIQWGGGAANGIPVAGIPVGTLASGGAGTAGQSLEAQTALFTGSSAMTLSQPYVFPAFTAALNQIAVNNPGPPLLKAAWTASTQYWAGISGGAGGSYVVDPNNVPSIWQASAISSGISGASTPFGTAGSTPCTTAGTTTITDGGVTWLCVLKGVAVTAQAYTAGAEVWDATDGAFQQAETSFTSNGAPSFSPNFGGTSTGDNGTWINIGRNAVPKPGFEFATAECSTSASTKYCSGLKGTGSISYNWSGCSVNATCGSGQTPQTSNLATTGGGVSPPSLTISAVSCPAGFSSGYSGSAAVKVLYAWATPNGLTPPLAESNSVTPTSSQCVSVPAPANPPPDAVGYEIYDGSTSLNESLHTPDGQTLIAGNGTLSQYVPNLGHGELIALGVGATIISPSGSKTPPLGLNTTGTMLSLGGQPPLTQQYPGGRYHSRLEDVQLELGSSLGNLDTYGGGVFNSSAQEHSGVYRVTVSDAAAFDGYFISGGAQNSELVDVKDAGSNADYKECWRIESVPPFRGINGATGCGASIGTQWDSIAAFHILTPPWSALSSGIIHIQNTPDNEAVIDVVKVENSAVVVDHVSGQSSIATRKATNIVHLGPWAHDATIRGIQSPQGACAVQDDTLSPACMTGSSAYVAKYETGNVSGNASPSEYLSSSDANVIGNFAAGYAIPWLTQPFSNSNGITLSSSANKAYLYGVVLTFPVTTTQVTYYVATQDSSSSNTYDIGIYQGTSGGTDTLLAHVGSTAGTTFAPSIGWKTLNWTASTTLQPGRYYLAVTSSCITSCAQIGSGSTNTGFTFDFNNALGISSGGTLPASITGPTDAYAVTSIPVWAVH